MDAPLQAVLAASISFIFISSIFALVFVLCRRDPSQKTSDLEAHARPRPRPRSRSHSKPTATSVAVDESVSFDPSISKISMTEMLKSTDNFSKDLIIGDGGFGFVYKAKLSDGVNVAVKRLSADAFHGFREFRAEMDTLGNIQHRNLVRLLAYCISGRDRLLVYEFLDGGSLDQWLYCTESVDLGVNPVMTSQLCWSTRVRIVRGVAEGLAFLHEECSPPIIHRDIKASNVLLDAELEARIADFGLARRVNSSRSIVLTQEAAGTVGYMPPEYIRGTTTVATKKGDVYSFGILMLEVMTRRRPNLSIREDGKEMHLAQWAKSKVERGRDMEILDPEIGEDMSGLVKEQVRKFQQLAFRCTEENPKMRPKMGEVVSALNEL